MKRHLLFYDGECGLCDRIVQFVFKADKREQFYFAPLKGETAARELQGLPSDMKQVDSLILIQNWGSTSANFYLQGKGALRISWLLGGPWKLIGWLSFLPSAPFDAAYRLVAKNRHRLFSTESCRIPSNAERKRFLR